MSAWPMRVAHSASHGHDSHAAPAAAVPGEPVEFLSDASQSSTARCKRRWNDLVLLRLDALAPATTVGPDARFKDETEVYKQIRERYLLFVGCIESKPGSEPKHAYLYPQAK